MDTILEIFTSGDIWAIILKVTLTALVGAITAWLCTLIAELLVKSKHSRLCKYAAILVDAAEQKYPNEGTQMGPQKLDYVMSQLVIKFPKIKDSQYLYNIVEQAVYKINEKRYAEKAALDFYKKFNEWPIGFEPSDELLKEVGLLNSESDIASDVADTESTEANVNDVPAVQVSIVAEEPAIDETGLAQTPIIKTQSTNTVVETPVNKGEEPKKITSKVLSSF